MGRTIQLPCGNVRRNFLPRTKKNLRATLAFPWSLVSKTRREIGAQPGHKDGPHKMGFSLVSPKRDFPHEHETPPQPARSRCFGHVHVVDRLGDFLVGSMGTARRWAGSSDGHFAGRIQARPEERDE